MRTRGERMKRPLPAYIIRQRNIITVFSLLPAAERNVIRILIIAAEESRPLARLVCMKKRRSL